MSNTSPSESDDDNQDIPDGAKKGSIYITIG